MIVTLKANHFRGTCFRNGTKCPIATSIKDKSPSTYVSEGVSEVQIGKVRYAHDRYETEMYEEDLRKAQDFCFSPDIIIRTLKLKKVNVNERAMAPVEE